MPEPMTIVGTFRWEAAGDNYPVTRTVLSGKGAEYIPPAPDDPRHETVTLDAGDLPDDATRAAYLLDDGRRVRPMYVAGWAADGRTLHLHDMPTNYRQGNRRHRPDGREVDMFGWRLGPRRVYHLKIYGWTACTDEARDAMRQVTTP